MFQEGLSVSYPISKALAMRDRYAFPGLQKDTNYTTSTSLYILYYHVHNVRLCFLFINLYSYIKRDGDFRVETEALRLTHRTGLDPRDGGKKWGIFLRARTPHHPLLGDSLISLRRKTSCVHVQANAP